jgi:hypothetical protein
MAATVGVAVETDGGGGSGAVKSGGGFPSLTALPSRSARVRTVGGGSGSEPRNPNHWPPPPIYSTARRGPTSHIIGLGVLDQDTRLGPRHGRWAKSGGDQTNTVLLWHCAKKTPSVRPPPPRLPRRAPQSTRPRRRRRGRHSRTRPRPRSARPLSPSAMLPTS